MSYQDSRTADGYEQDLDDSDHAIELLERVLGRDLAEAHDGFAKRRVPVARPKKPARRAMEHSWESKTYRVAGISRSG
jgi:hypothetical protein